MARQNRPDEWSQFLRRASEALRACGIPDEVSKDQMRFVAFLERGFDQWGQAKSPDAFFDARVLSDAQIARLAEFAARSFGEEYRVRIASRWQGPFGVTPPLVYPPSEPEKLIALVTMMPRIEGRPCVHVGSRDGSVCLCQKITGIRIEWDTIGQSIGYSVIARNFWVDPQRARPDSLTDMLRIGNDCLEVGPDWWLDTYFGWYLVFDPELVARSRDGDHSWVSTFLKSVPRLGAEPSEL